MLNTTDHSRDSAGMTYVYPVVSRRAGGISVGINLNPNNACNWQCIYCQVPGLTRGSAPDVDLALLDRELRSLLGEIHDGVFFEHFEVEPEYRVIRDIAISGNGEPTTCRLLPEVMDIIDAAMRDFSLHRQINVVLITNGSQMAKPHVRQSLLKLDRMGGNVWFKVDSVTADGLKRINQAAISPAQQLEQLKQSAALCRTWIQHCCFQLDGNSSPEQEQLAFCRFLDGLLAEHVPVQGVMLYGLARPSAQPGGSRLQRIPAELLEKYVDRIKQTGIEVRTSY